MVAATHTDTAGVEEWAITDEPNQLRDWGTAVVHSLPSPHSVDATTTIGASSDCWLQLSDPKNKISRYHVSLLRHAGRWKVADLNSKNGITLDGARRPAFYLTPGVEVGIGGVVLIAESPRLIQLRDLLARLIGWSDARRADVDNALRSVRIAATRRESLSLCGAGSLISIARLLHNHLLGENRPFVVCDPRRRRDEPDARAATNYSDGLVALREAIGGTICLWKERPLARFGQVTEQTGRPTSRVQLMVCSHELPDPRLPLMGPTVVLSPLSERASEVPRVVEEFGRDAASELGGVLTQASADWVLQHDSANLPRIATATRRIVALNSVGGSTSHAASLLGMARSSLLEWLAARPSGYT